MLCNARTASNYFVDQILENWRRYWKRDKRKKCWSYLCWIRKWWKLQIAPSGRAGSHRSKGKLWETARSHAKMERSTGEPLQSMVLQGRQCLGNCISNIVQGWDCLHSGIKMGCTTIWRQLSSLEKWTRRHLRNFIKKYILNPADLEQLSSALQRRAGQSCCTLNWIWARRTHLQIKKEQTSSWMPWGSKYQIKRVILLLYPHENHLGPVLGSPLQDRHKDTELSPEKSTGDN